jgi:hypothetical protein
MLAQGRLGKDAIETIVAMTTQSARMVIGGSTIMMPAQYQRKK